MKAVVYWLLDERDNVLYVGFTMGLKSRMASHAYTKTWWPSVASVAHTGVMSREEALRVEREDILDLQPRYNVASRIASQGVRSRPTGRRKPTSTYLLLEERLGRPLDKQVIKARSRGQSWNQIARELDRATGVAVTAEWLRIWFLPRATTSAA